MERMTFEQKKQQIRDAVYMATVNAPFVIPCLPNIASAKIDFIMGEYCLKVMMLGGQAIYYRKLRAASPCYYKTVSRARKALEKWLSQEWMPDGAKTI